MAEEDIDCRKIFQSIEDTTNKLIQINLNEQIKTDTVCTINNKIDEMHKMIDLKGDEFISMIINSFTVKQEEKVEQPKEGDVKKKSKKAENKERVLREKEISELTNEIEKKFQSKMLELMDSVDNIINQTAIIEGATEFFKSTKINDLIKINKDEFSFKVKRNLTKYLNKKACIDLEWDVKKNNATYSSVDKSDSSQLNIKGTTCYTYYQTVNEFTDEDVTIELEYKISTTDNYFYLGFINQTVVPSSNCMCCTIQNAVYIQPNGDVVVNGSRQNNQKLSANKNQVHQVVIRLNATDKEVFFQMDDKEEVGPFKIPGNKFRFVSGSCNTVTGYVKILNAFS